MVPHSRRASGPGGGGAARPRLRAGRLRPCHPPDGGRARLGATRLAEPQLRAARRHARRHGLARAATGWSRWTRTGSTTQPSWGPSWTPRMAQRADARLRSAQSTRPRTASLRNFASRAAKGSSGRLLVQRRQRASFNSYRFILGEVGRSVAAYAGSGVYLDVALGWVAGRIGHLPGAPAGRARPPLRVHRCRSLLSHYWRMVITGGTRLLRAGQPGRCRLRAAGLRLCGLRRRISVLR